MGREIRRVPPNWEHPRYTEDNAHRRQLIGEFIPMHDRDFESAAAEWLSNCKAWDAGTHPDCEKYKADYPYYWMWEDPPNPDTHRPAFTEEPTWFQMYETVSEGTPCTPPFGQKSSLVNWLVEKGESHGTQYERRYSREQAWAFVEQEWAPSFVFTQERGLESGVEHAEVVGK